MSVCSFLFPKRGICPPDLLLLPQWPRLFQKELEGTISARTVTAEHGSSTQKKRRPHDKTITTIQKTMIAKYAAENGSVWKFSA